MLQTTRMDLLRCANPDSPCGGRCLGCLDENDDVLTCRECGASYSVVLGVPVIKRGHGEEAETWFESMYQGRSRYDDVATEYLRSEREFMARFVIDHGLEGQVLKSGVEPVALRRSCPTTSVWSTRSARFWPMVSSRRVEFAATRGGCRSPIKAWNASSALILSSTYPMLGRRSVRWIEYCGGAATWS